jgi:hypothetical protein
VFTLVTFQTKKKKKKKIDFEFMHHFRVVLLQHPKLANSEKRCFAHVDRMVGGEVSKPSRHVQNTLQ